MCYQLDGMNLMCSRQAAEDVDASRDKYILAEHEVQETLLRIKKLEEKISLTNAEQYEYDTLVNESEKCLQRFTDAMRDVNHAREKWLETTEGQIYLSNRIHLAKTKNENDAEAESLLRRAQGKRHSLLDEWYNANPQGGWCPHKPSLDEVRMAVALGDEEHPSLLKARYVGHHGVINKKDIYTITECTAEGFVTLKRNASAHVESLNIHHIPLSDIRLWLI